MKLSGMRARAGNALCNAGHIALNLAARDESLLPTTELSSAGRVQNSH